MKRYQEIHHWLYIHKFYIKSRGVTKFLVSCSLILHTCSKLATYWWILSTTGNFTNSILGESSILRCCRLHPLITALVWSFACTCNAMLLSSINVQHFRDTFFCKVLCSCCVSLKVVSDQISGPVFSHYFSWLHNNILHNNSLLHILHALSWLSNPDWNILVYYIYIIYLNIC